MSNNTISYKGYTAKIEYDNDEKLLFGKVLFMNDLIMFDGTTEEIEQSFKDAVDGYLIDCEENDLPVDKPFSGSFNVRLGEDMHRKAAIAASSLDIKLNEFVKTSIKEKLECKSIQHSINVNHNHKVEHFFTERTEMTIADFSEKPKNFNNTMSFEGPLRNAKEQ